MTALTHADLGDWHAQLVGAISRLRHVCTRCEPVALSEYLHWPLVAVERHLSDLLAVGVVCVRDGAWELVGLDSRSSSDSEREAA
jgi:hypothetical protein